MLPLLLLLSGVQVLQNRANGQDPVTAGLARDLEKYSSQRLQEKVWVHTDKEFYLAGEICWFKLYDVDASLHRPLDLSKTAYLEWLDKNHRPVLQTKIGLREGHGGGSVYLPLTLASGNYTLRAYTSWMKNDGAEWFFEKTITVVNARKSAGVPSVGTPLRYDVAFFPEGGNLVENLRCKIGFKAADQYGRGVECTGVVTEDDEDTIVRFRPGRFGIGSFMLRPRPGHRYRSTIRLADGTAISNLLPAAYKEGVAMHVSKEGNDRVRVDVQSTGGLIGGKEGKSPGVYLFVHTRRSVRVVEAASLVEGKCSFLVDEKSLGDGISHLTIFNADRLPVCERLFYKPPSHLLQIGVSTDKSTYAPRKKIDLRVSAKVSNDSSLGADCSLSVYRLDSLQGIPSGHIASYLLLTSDLNERIESPDYYLDHPEDEEAIDNLMLTHGWRRFKWGDILQHATPSFRFAPEYGGEVITGRVVDTRTGKAAGGVQVYLSVPGTRTQFSSGLSNEEGEVKFEMGDFYGGQEIILQTDPSIDSICRLDVSNPFSEEYTHAVPPLFVPPLPSTQAITDKMVAVQVLNRYAGGRLKQFDFPVIDTSAFYVRPDFSYLLDDYTRFITMEEVMREYVRLMLVKKKGGHFHLPLFDLSNDQFFLSDPLILLDGVPIFDIDKFMTMDPLKIRKLDVLTRKYFMGGVSYDGIMNWITYKGDLGGYILDPHATVIDYEGLQLQREFYSPSYATADEAATHLPDFRNVLYWSPEVAVDNAGGGVASFYSSDIPGQYVAIVEGLAGDGAAGSGMVKFEVR